MWHIPMAELGVLFTVNMSSVAAFGATSRAMKTFSSSLSLEPK